MMTKTEFKKIYNSHMAKLRKKEERYYPKFKRALKKIIIDANCKNKREAIIMFKYDKSFFLSESTVKGWVLNEYPFLENVTVTKQDYWSGKGFSIQWDEIK